MISSLKDLLEELDGEKTELFWPSIFIVPPQMAHLVLEGKQMANEEFEFEALFEDAFALLGEQSEGADDESQDISIWWSSLAILELAYNENGQHIAIEVENITSDDKILEHYKTKANLKNFSESFISHEKSSKIV